MQSVNTPRVGRGQPDREAEPTAAAEEVREQMGRRPAFTAADELATWAAAPRKALMEAMWEEVGRRWLAEYQSPIGVPEGFELDPGEVGPTRRRTGCDGWYLSSVDSETREDDELVAMFPDGAGSFRLMARVAESDPRVQRVQLWVDDDCVWAARRRRVAQA